MADEYNLIHNGMEDELEKINRLTVGSDERLSAMKAMQIRYNLDLSEYELGLKLADMEKRAALEREKFEFEQEKAEQERMEREEAAKTETRRFRIQTGLAAAGLAISVGFAALGMWTDNSENIRNNNRDRDRDRIFNIGDKLRERIGK